MVVVNEAASTLVSIFCFNTEAFGCDRNAPDRGVEMLDNGTDSQERSGSFCVPGGRAKPNLGAFFHRFRLQLRGQKAHRYI